MDDIRNCNLHFVPFAALALEDICFGTTLIRLDRSQKIWTGVCLDTPSGSKMTVIVE